MLFFYNWFTSLCLVEELKCKGFLCVGTVRLDRTQKRSLAPDAAFKAQERGSIDFRLDEQSKIGVIKWFDNSSVHIVSSYAIVQLTEICKRWNTKEKCSVDMFHTLSP